MKTLYKLALALALLFSANAVFAQTDGELQRGITLYRQGAYDEAINVLEALSKIKGVKDEPTVLNYLGLSYMEQNELKKARKTLERAALLAPQNVAVRTSLAYAYLRSDKSEDAFREAARAVDLDAKSYTAYFIRGTSFLRLGKADEAIADANQAIKLKADFAPAYLLKADTLAGVFGNRINAGGLAKDNAEMLGKAVETLEECVKNCAKDGSLPTLNEKLDAFQAFYRYFSRDNASVTPVATTEGTFKIIAKPRANYTDQARSAGRQGRVVLAVMFKANGTIGEVMVIKGLGYGLDEEVIKAARGIRFSPLTKNGTPVSVVKTLEYSFSIGGR